MTNYKNERVIADLIMHRGKIQPPFVKLGHVLRVVEYQASKIDRFEQRRQSQRRLIIVSFSPKALDRIGEKLIVTKRL